ncbi:DUF2637 domain-containing protein [Actinomadura gamaensis]|uniref:DUF2637 domain-containing protein n=1 Tax=Actinomadura gamaensis TaxID=1763541 RepID=A0ABV9UEI9_9ACTN
MDAPTDCLIRATTTTSVALLVLTAAVASWRHMRRLALDHGESARTAALIPLSVDGVILASSLSILCANRASHRGGRLARAHLIVGRLASLAAKSPSPSRRPLAGSSRPGRRSPWSGPTRC